MSGVWHEGDWWVIDDVTGLKVRASDTAEQWDGQLVRKKYFEERHPQDFVRGIKDDMMAPFSRPRAVDVFVGPLITTLTADAAAGAILLFVDSNIRMLAGDRITVFLDTGDTFTTTISNSSTLGQIQINPGLPSLAKNGAQVTDYTAMSQGSLP